MVRLSMTVPGGRASATARMHSGERPVGCDSTQERRAQRHRAHVYTSTGEDTRDPMYQTGRANLQPLRSSLGYRSISGPLEK